MYLIAIVLFYSGVQMESLFNQEQEDNLSWAQWQKDQDPKAAWDTGQEPVSKKKRKKEKKRKKGRGNWEDDSLKPAQANNVNPHFN
jgi:hypothetical protein